MMAVENETNSSQENATFPVICHRYYFNAKYKKFKKFLETVTLDHDTPFYYYWLWFISVTFLYNVVFIPLRGSFTDFNLDNLALWLPLDYICDLVYLVDMFIKSRMRYYQQGIQIYDVKLLRRRYFRSVQFFVDVVSVLPTDLAYIGCGLTYTTVRLNRILRYGRLFEMTNRVSTQSQYANTFRAILTVLGQVAAIYYGAIFYHSFSKSVGWGESDDDYPLSKDASELPFLTRFMRCLYWSCMTVMFIGEQPSPRTIGDYIVEIVVWLTGLTIFGVIVGQLGEILDNMNAAGDAFKRQLDGVRGYLTFQKAPPDVSSKVVQWFGYAYMNNVLGNAEKVLKPLPDRLKSEIANDLHLASLKKVQLFADMETTLLAELVTRFKLQVFSPQDYVCKKGDIGREMYVVKSGSLEVVSDDGGKVFVTLGQGTVFGEISLLSIPGSRTGNRRTANVRSKGYSNLFSLSKEDLYAVLADYPGSMQKLVDKGTDILRKEKKLDEDAITRKEAEEAELSAKFEKMTQLIEETEKTLALLITGIRYSHQKADERLSVIENCVAVRTKIRCESAPVLNNVTTPIDGNAAKFLGRKSDSALLDTAVVTPSVSTSPAVSVVHTPVPVVSVEKANVGKEQQVFKRKVSFVSSEDIIPEEEMDAEPNVFDTTSEISDDIPTIPEDKETPDEKSMSVSTNNEKEDENEQQPPPQQQRGNDDGLPPEINVTGPTPEYQSSTDESEMSEVGSSTADDDLNNYFYDDTTK